MAPIKPVSSRCAVRCSVAVALLVSAACSSKLDGPKPALATKDKLPLSPTIVCGDQLTTELTISGEGLSPVPVNIPKKPAIALPSLTLSRVSAADGGDADALQVVYGGDPTAPSNTSDLVWDSQTQMRAKIHQSLDIDGKQGRVPSGIYDVRISNPNGHTSVAKAALAVVDKPTLTGPSPAQLCLGGAELPLNGTGLLRIGSALPKLRIEGMDKSFDVAGLDECETVAQDDVDAELCKVARVSLPSSAVTPGMYEVTITNPETAACHSEETLQVRVDVAPIVFFVDPPTVYKEIATEVTVFTSGLGSTAKKVELVRDGNQRETLNFTNGSSPNKILAQVPKGLTAGAWDVVVTNDVGCPGVLASGLTISDTLTDSLVTSIKPSYASTTEDTAVTISGAGFAPVPRVYLSLASSSGTARALRAVTVASAGATLTAVIPSGLTPGAYDLIVVNPDGATDVLGAGVTITADKPPVINTVTPASLPANASGVPVTLSGTGFKSNPTVALDCQTTAGARTTVATNEQAPSGDGTRLVVNVTMSSASPSGVDAGSVCLVRLTNADGAFFEYSAFSVTNSSLNLSPWSMTSSTPALGTARRALSLVAGRPTASSRFLYAIGGDSGASMPTAVGSSVFDSIESSQVDVFGTMSDWSTQRNHLPAPRTAAGAASIGRFVYLVGGRDASTATNTLYRASILDPLAGPEVTDVDAALGDGNKGLGKGLYYYRVSALERADDAENPRGETLGGELLPVQLPERSEKITLSLRWKAITGAHGYRVYRSREANAAADDLLLIGEITCGSENTSCDCTADASRCQLRDDGLAAMDGKSPLPAGSLGVWHAVDGARCSSGDCQLASAREGLAVTAVNDPTNQSQWYLYAFGGRNQSGMYLDSYEVATVTIAADGSQTVGDFAAGSDTLQVPRADHGVWIMSKLNSNVIAASGSPNDVWVYVGGGRTTGGATNKTLEAGKLGANGVLAAFVATDPLNGDLVGFGTGAANDQLYTFGGIAGSSDGTSASLCNGMGSCNPLPDLRPGAFNSLGAATTRRMFAGSTQESAFFFVAGGHDGSTTLKSAQRTVQ